MHRDEAPECGAVRELFEETGITIEPAALQLADVSKREGRYGERTTYLFEVRLLGDAPQIRVNGWEITAGSLVDARGLHTRPVGRPAPLYQGMAGQGYLNTCGLYGSILRALLKIQSSPKCKVQKKFCSEAYVRYDSNKFFL